MMKKMRKRMLCVLISLFSPILVFGDGFLDDTLSYSIRSGSEVEVVGLKDCSVKVVRIPKTVKYEYYDYDDLDDEGNAKVKYETYKVTKIGGLRFLVAVRLRALRYLIALRALGVLRFMGAVH